MTLENSVYAVIERIHDLDVDASVVTSDQRIAMKEIADLEKKSKLCESVLTKSRNEMSFNEAELLRLYKKMDELDEKKSNRLAKPKSDDEHRSSKRDVEYIERDLRDVARRVDDTETRIEQSKKLFFQSEHDLNNAISASQTEYEKARSAQESTSGRLSEIAKVRDNYLHKLDDRVSSQYRRVSNVTRNPHGPICRVVGSACGNCRIGLSPQTLNHVLRGKVIDFCPNCSHILLPENRN